MSRRKLAVVLFNLGGPDSPEAVRPFLFNLFNDPAIIAAPGPIRRAIASLISRTREKTAQANYAHMGGRSPLLANTREQAAALDRALLTRLPDWEVRSFIAMRYWAPFTAEAAREVEAFAPDEIVLLPLYPQYSSTTVGSSLEAWRKAYAGPGRVRTVCCHPELDGLVEAHAQRIRETWEAAGRPGPIRLIFSAHGLPESVVRGGDPYQMQIERTCAAIAARLGPDWDWTLGYQSRVGPMKWLGPTTPDQITAATREGRGVLVAPVAFVSEHVETLVELDIDFAEAAKAGGCALYLRAPALGVAPAYIQGLAVAVGQSLERPAGVEAAAGGRLCGSAWSKCPAQVRERCA